LKVFRGQNVNTPTHPNPPYPMNVVREVSNVLGSFRGQSVNREVSVTSTVLGPLAKICVIRYTFGFRPPGMNKAPWPVANSVCFYLSHSQLQHFMLQVLSELWAPFVTRNGDYCIAFAIEEHCSISLQDFSVMYDHAKKTCKSWHNRF
jgi:hypothetical protein